MNKFVKPVVVGGLAYAGGYAATKVPFLQPEAGGFDFRPLLGSVAGAFVALMFVK